MSREELIKAIEALPPDKQKEVEALVRRLSDKVESSREVTYASDSQVAEAASLIFEKHAELFRKLAD